MKKLKAKGTLGRILADVDDTQLYKTENRMRMAMKIAMTLRAKGLSNKQFAEMLGCSAPEVSDLLSGTRNLTIDKLSDIESKLGVELINHSTVVFATVHNDMLSIKQGIRRPVEYVTRNTLLYDTACHTTATDTSIQTKAY